MNQPIICRHKRLGQLGRQSLLGRTRAHPVDHLLDAPRHARLGRRLLELPGAIDIGEALADEIDQAESMRSISALTSSMLAQSLGLRGAMASSSSSRKPDTTASASISTSQSGLMKPETSSMLERRADIAEELAMHAADRLPMGDVDEIGPGADHVLEAGAGILPAPYR